MKEEEIILMEMTTNDGQKHWRYQRQSDVEWVSPLFFTEDAANFFAGRMPFLSDAEWLLQPKVSAKLALKRLKESRNRIIRPR